MNRDRAMMWAFLAGLTLGVCSSAPPEPPTTAPAPTCIEKTCNAGYEWHAGCCKCCSKD